MTNGPVSFWRFFFRGPPPGPLWRAPLNGWLASTPGGREQWIGVVGRQPLSDVAMAGVRTQVARATAAGSAL